MKLALATNWTQIAWARLTQNLKVLDKLHQGRLEPRTSQQPSNWTKPTTIKPDKLFNHITIIIILINTITIIIIIIINICQHPISSGQIKIIFANIKNKKNKIKE